MSYCNYPRTWTDFLNQPISLQSNLFLVPWLFSVNFQLLFFVLEILHIWLEDEVYV